LLQSQISAPGEFWSMIQLGKPETTFPDHARPRDRRCWVNRLRPRDAVAASNLRKRPGNAQRNAAARLRPPPLAPL